MFTENSYAWERFDEAMFFLGLDTDEQEDFFDSYDLEE